MDEDKFEESLIGPHEGKEFILLDSELKHVALFYEIIPEEYFVYRDKEQYGCIEFSNSVKRDGVPIADIFYVILYRKTHEQQARRLAEIVKNGYENYYLDGERIEREIGEILSYPIEAVDYFIGRSKKRGSIA